MPYGPRRNFSRGGGGFRRNFGPREMHKATCSECGNECEVPFKPTEGKPVYCRDCYMKKKGITPRKPREEESEESETKEVSDSDESEDEEESKEE